MKSRPFRATDRQWDDLKLVTPAAVRAWVTKEAARLRRMKPNVEVTGTAAALSPEAPLERRVRARVNTEIDMTCKHGWNWKQHETCPMCEEVNAAVAAERAAWMKAVTDEPELPSEMPDEMWNVLRSDRDAATETLRIIVRQTKGGILTRGMRSNV